MDDVFRPQPAGFVYAHPRESAHLGAPSDDKVDPPSLPGDGCEAAELKRGMASQRHKTLRVEYGEPEQLISLQRSVL